ncbi:MAG TPA: DUF4124 domain-containing protein [Gammaproteobacteria bacterium]|nr:DUF4124 domain-containing protein [Gammaproteobacteria bacterium]
MRPAALACALCAGLLLTAAVHADTVYRWVDKDGHVHYSQTPPANSKAAAKAVEVVPPPPDPTTVARMQDMQQAVHDKKEAHQALANRAQQEADKKAKQEKACAAARARAERYAQVNRAVKRDKDGNLVYSSGEDLVKLQQQAEKEATKLCGAK